MSVVRSPCERVVIEHNQVRCEVIVGAPPKSYAIKAPSGCTCHIWKSRIDDLICVLTELKGVLDGDPQGAGPVRSSE